MSAQLIDLRKIWDRAPHNAMTDLMRFRGRWLCVFREGTDHISPDGVIRVLASDNGIQWDSLALLEIPGFDLRDPKLTATPAGLLMLISGAACSPQAAQRHQSFIWFSANGIDWGTPEKIGEPDFWLWRATWHKGIAYSVGYHTVGPLGTRLYSSRNGLRFDVLADRLCTEDFPNEATMAFQTDDSALCLLRCDAGKASAKLGSSRPPYTEWSWKDLGLRIGGPNLLVLPDGRIVAAVRRYGKKAWTSLNWLDPAEGRLEEFLALPSGGDTSYAGLCLHEDTIWASYYSSHEQRTSIYLARIRLSF